MLCMALDNRVFGSPVVLDGDEERIRFDALFRDDWHDAVRKAILRGVVEHFAPEGRVETAVLVVSNGPSHTEKGDETTKRALFDLIKKANVLPRFRIHFGPLGTGRDPVDEQSLGAEYAEILELGDQDVNVVKVRQIIDHTAEYFAPLAAPARAAGA
jgi:hypothetical protein